MTLAAKRLAFVGRLAAAAALLVLWPGAADVEAGTNMAFRHHKVIHPIGLGAKGRNFLALPDKSPYHGPDGLNRLCDHLNLASNGQITQINAQVGTVNTHLCGSLQVSPLTPGVGVIILNPTATSGVIVGHDQEGLPYTFHDLGSPPRGQNLFPVEYHATAVTPEDICTQCGLTSPATITRFDALNGTVNTHPCGSLPLYDLIQGEAVLIQEPNGPKTCTPDHY